MTIVLRMRQRISNRLDIDVTEQDQRVEKLAQETNVYELMQDLQKELPPEKPR